jgi:putative transposase
MITLHACYRYIEMNPVRARTVKHPRFYRWSSYRCNAEGATSALVTPHEHYRALGRNETERRLAYRAFFKTDLDPEVLSDIRAATNGNYALGSPASKTKAPRY